MQGQPVTVCGKVFDAVMLRIINFLVCLLAWPTKESAFIRSGILQNHLLGRDL